MEAIIEKIKSINHRYLYGSGITCRRIFPAKPAPHTPVKETNLQAEVAAVSKDSSTERK